MSKIWLACFIGWWISMGYWVFEFFYRTPSDALGALISVFACVVGMSLSLERRSK